MPQTNRRRTGPLLTGAITRIHTRRVVAALTASVAAATAVVVAVTPAYATAGSPLLDKAFQTNVRDAVRSVFPAARLMQSEDLTQPSSLGTAEGITVSAALVNVGPKASVFVLRHVGAVPDETARVFAKTDTAKADTAMLTLERPAAGRIQAQVTTPGRLQDGLSSIGWTERTGVNYRVIGRGDVSTGQLTAVATALPADSSRPSTAAMEVIARSAASVAVSVQAEPMGTADGFVAGTGEPSDDFGDEATLRNGGSYWRSNYTALWQMILYSDLDSVVSGDVDCEFGPRTAEFTRQFQAMHQIGQSYTLDAVTRDRADNPTWLERTLADGSDYAWRPGYWSYIYIHRLGPNLSPRYRWDVRNIFDDNDWHGAAYTYANYWFC